MVRLILITWIKLSQMERFQLSHGQTQVRKHFTLHNSLLELASIGQILWKVLTVMLLWW